MTVDSPIKPSASRRPKQLRTMPGTINMVLRQRDPPRFYLDLARKFGPVAYFKFGPIDSYLVSDPELIRDVFVTNAKRFGRPLGAKILRNMMLGHGLLTSDGDLHMRQRRTMQPAFHRKRIAGYGQTMVTISQAHAEHWASLPAGSTVDVAEEMMHLTLAIVGKTLLDADVLHDAPEVGESMDTLIHAFDRTMNPLHLLLGRMGLTSNESFYSARRSLDAIIFRIIEERRCNPGDRGDLLSMLLEAQDEQAAEGAESGMSDQQVRDEAMTLFLAGHETTALALTWAFMLISQHPQVRTQLQAEWDTVLGQRAPGFDDLPQLRYTEQVISETLRLYPPAWLVARATVQPHDLAGFHLEPRSGILVSPYVVHRNPELYPDPLAFKPERWTPEFKAGLPKLGYLPFGGGNRVCIGEGFAWAEAILVLATLGQRWNLHLKPGHDTSAKAMITLRPKFGMPMQLEPR
jgi:cytochrome P450